MKCQYRGYILAEPVRTLDQVFLAEQDYWRRGQRSADNLAGGSMRVLLFAYLLAIAPTLEAQRPQAPTADAVARDFFEAFEAGRYLEASRHLDTAFIAQTKRRLLESYRIPRVTTPVSADDIMKHDPTMPRVVAEYYANQAARSEQEFNELEFMFADVPDTTALKLLSVRDLAARWVEARDVRYTMRKLFLSQRCRKNGDDSTAQVIADSAITSIPIPRKEVLGVVARRDTAYVLYREIAASDETSSILNEPRVMTMISRDRWRILANEAFSGTSVAFGCD